MAHKELKVLQVPKEEHPRQEIRVLKELKDQQEVHHKELKVLKERQDLLQ